MSATSLRATIPATAAESAAPAMGDPATGLRQRLIISTLLSVAALLIAMIPALSPATDKGCGYR